jgi:hypothetical protein
MLWVWSWRLLLKAHGSQVTAHGKTKRLTAHDKTKGLTAHGSQYKDGSRLTAQGSRLLRKARLTAHSSLGIIKLSEKQLRFS